MHAALPSLFIALTFAQAPREQYQTANFVVYAETIGAAKRIGDAAEAKRAELAKLWLGTEIPAWPAPCRIDVADGPRPGGVTEVSFSDGKVLFHRVKLHGPLERLLTGPLPHELTHVLFAHHFGWQPPRWADEGGAILSEGESLGALHRKKFREILDKRGQFPLREFLAMKQYPADIPCLYAQGHSVSGFLVAAKGRQVFLAFVRDGCDRTWDDAVRDRYGYQNVEQLETAWLDWVEKQAKAAK